MDEHLTDLSLELLRTGEADDADMAHLSICSVCRTRHQQLVSLATLTKEHCPAISISKERDQAVMAVIAQRAIVAKTHQAVRRDRRWRRWALIPVAAALLALLSVSLFDRAPQERPIETTGADDLNRDGQVDILDAFELARDLTAQDTANGRTRADLERIIHRSVALESRR